MRDREMRQPCRRGGGSGRGGWSRRGGWIGRGGWSRHRLKRVGLGVPRILFGKPKRGLQILRIEINRNSLPGTS